MSVLSRLFPCRACDAKSQQIASLEREVEWARRQIDAQNKRLVEIAEPHANSRIAVSERPRRSFVPAGPPPVTLPGFEAPPPIMIEVDEEGTTS